MMKYSKNMKKLFNRYKLYILMFTVVFTLIAITTACNDSTETTGLSVRETELSTIEVTSESEQSEPEYISLGEYKLTAYCGCPKCCGKWGENRPIDENGKPIVYTANQSIAEEGVTIAADINVLPYGTAVIIDGHKYIVQDRGGSIVGNKIDIYFESHQAALEFGVQYKEVFIEREVENND